MKVKTSGFAWDFKNVNIFDFLHYLKKDVAYIRDNRILVVDSIKNTDNLWGGYLLNIREEKASTQVKLTEEELEVVVKRIVEKDVYNGEFNFFLINGHTRKGLFQTYFNAAPWSYFSFYLSHRFNKFARDEKLKDVSFTPRALFRQQSIEEYINQFERIKEIVIEASHYEVTEPSFRRLEEQAQRRIEIFKFYKRKKWDLGTIKESLLSIINEEKADDLKVSGVISGVDTVYELVNNVEVFYDEEYEDWIKNLSFTDKNRLNSVNSSQTIKELVRIYNETLVLTRLDQRD